MKNANEKHAEAILNCIKKTPNITLEGIKEQCPKVSDILIRKLLKDMLNSNTIVVNQDDGTYSFMGSKKTEEQPKETKTEKREAGKTEAKTTDKKKEEADLGPATVSGKDFTKYDFNGLKGLSKSRLAHAIVKEYVSKNGARVTLSKLEEVFKSMEIQKRYGVIQELSKGKKISGNRERYFMKPEEILKVGNQKVVVCNQWSSETLKPLMAIAKNLGYKITVSK